MYDMKVYLEKEKQNATQMMTAKNVTMRCLTKRTEGEGHKLSLKISSPLHTNFMTCTKRCQLLWDCQAIS
jgi:hypothetical protein